MVESKLIIEIRIYCEIAVRSLKYSNFMINQGANNKANTTYYITQQ